ncbi:hypothetical protein ACTMTF_02965 [Nonomuraea sp. ZG12]|uniref:hypothetical protein n=1 Tax=Nonomuraea sp. ZG12 TaxID=3452207 RepID=UPI003F8A1EF5
MTDRDRFDQWSYFEERDLAGAFVCSWVEAPDHRAVVTRLRAEEETLACDLNQARRWHHPLSQEDVVWVADQSPGWVKLFALSGSCLWWALDSLPQPGGRAFYLSYDQAIGRVSDPVYVDEGRWLDMPPDVWDRPMKEGAHLVGSSGIAQEMNLFLAVMGYTTGRFVDDTWFTTPGLLCRIRDGTWAP